MKRVLSLILVVVLALSVLLVSASCASTGDKGDKDAGGKYGNDIPGGVGDVSAEVLEALSESGTISVYNFNGSATEEDKRFEEYFEQVYGGKLDYRFKVWSYWFNDFMKDFAGNDAPDVTYVYNEFWPKLGSRGYVYSQRELKEMGIVGLDHPVITNSLELSESNYSIAGEIYSLDVYKVSPTVMAVNNKILKDCGVTKTPTDYYKEGVWNWDNFLEVCRQVHAIDKDGDGKNDYVGYAGWNGHYVIGMNDGRLIGIDKKTGMVSLNFDDIKVKNGFEMYNDIYAQKKYAEMNHEIAGGNLAMFVMEDFNIAAQYNKAVEANGKDAVKEWTVVPLPDGPNATEDYVYGFVEGNFIVSSTDNPQGCLNYIIEKHTFNDKYYKVNPKKDLTYWLDDEGDQMLADLQPRVFEGLWAGVANVFSNQWGLWEGLRAGKKSVTEVVEEYTPFFNQQCEIENQNRGKEKK